MQSPTFNPIYDRLTRGVHVPSYRATARIGAASIAAGALVAVMMQINGARLGDFVTAGLFCVGIGLSALFLYAGCALAAAITARYASDQDHALLRLSRITPETIVAGYAGGAIYRLRLLEAIGQWFPAGLLGADVLTGMPVIGMFRIEAGPLTVLGCGLLLLAILTAVLVGGIGGLNFTALWRAGIDVGVWVGLRWARQGLVAGGVVILAGMAVLVPVAVGLLLFPFFVLPLMICASAIMALWTQMAAQRLSEVARRRALGFISDQDAQ